MFKVSATSAPELAQVHYTFNMIGRELVPLPASIALRFDQGLEAGCISTENF